MFPAVNSQQRLSAGKPVRSSKKVPLKQGHSLVDWIRLSKSGIDLRGTGPRLLQINQEELSKHNKPNDLWMCIRGMVYNVTSYLEYHPGGADELMRGAGIDATSLFQEVHSWVNYESLLKECLVGRYIGLPTQFKSTLKENRNLLSPSTLSVSGLNPLGKNTLQISSLKNATSVPKINVQDFTSNPSTSVKENDVAIVVPSSKTDIKPDLDWYQSNAEVVVVLYTKCTNLKKHQIICDASARKICIDYYVDQKVVNFIITLQKDVRDNINVTLSDRGKVEVTMLKCEQNVNWDRLGTIQRSEKISRGRTMNEFRYCYCTVTSKSSLTHDTSLYRLSLPKSRSMFVPIGYHVYVKASINNDIEICKPYTVVLPSLLGNDSETAEYFSDLYLAIKHYEHGALTSILKDRSAGDKFLISTYDGDFNPGCLEEFDNFVLLAAGTGITPMVRVLHLLIKQKTDKYAHLLFFNKEQRDIIWNEEFGNMATNFNERFAYQNILSQPDDDWNGMQGRISKELLNKYVQNNLKSVKKEKLFFFICGPALFTKLSLTILGELGFNNIHAFT